MDIHDSIFDYVYMSAQEFAPEFEVDENGEVYEVQSILGYDVIRQLDRLEFPFTKEKYYKNHEIINTLNAYEIDIEKFWYAILFIYHVTKSKIADGVVLSPRGIDQMHVLLDYLRNGDKVSITVTADNKKKKLVVAERNVLKTIADLIEQAIPTLNEDLELQGRQINIDKQAKVGTKASSQIAFATARYQELFRLMKIGDKRIRMVKKKEKVEKEKGEEKLQKTVSSTSRKADSCSKKLLISRLMYFCHFTESEEYRYSEEPLNGVLKDYKDAEINIISRSYFL